MIGFFSERGFGKADMEKTLKEVTSMERDEALQYKKKKENERVPFVLTFHPRLRKLGTILHKHFHLLQSNERLRLAFTQPPMVAFRRLKNLRDMLVHSKMREEKKEEVSTSKCGGVRCKCCTNLMELKEFQVNGKLHKTRTGGTCKSSNVIYGVRCRKCEEKWYVGETAMRLHERMNQHRYSVGKVRRGESIDKSNDTGVSEHFGQDGHNFEEDAEVYILENGSWDSAEERQCKESYYISKYSTLEPTGLNKKPGTLGDLYEQTHGKI